MILVDGPPTEIDTHCSRSAALNQRLAASERVERSTLVDESLNKETEQKETSNSAQLEEKDRTCLGRIKRALYKANNGCSRAAEQILTGSSQATLSDDTMRKTQ